MSAVEELERVRDEVAQELEVAGTRWLLGYCAGLETAMRLLDSAINRAKQAAKQ